MGKNTNFYMVNLGSEFLRLFIWREKKDEDNAKSSALRCLKILDDLRSIENRPGVLKEAHMLQNILDNFLENNLKNYSIHKKDLESYFNPFDIRLMSAK